MSDMQAAIQDIRFPVRAVHVATSITVFWSIVDATGRYISSHLTRTHAESLAKLLNDREQILTEKDKEIEQLKSESHKQLTEWRTTVLAAKNCELGYWQNEAERLEKTLIVANQRIAELSAVCRVQAR